MKVRNTLKVFKTVKHVSTPVNIRNEATFLLKKRGGKDFFDVKKEGAWTFSLKKKKRQGRFWGISYTNTPKTTPRNEWPRTVLLTKEEGAGTFSL